MGVFDRIFGKKSDSNSAALQKPVKDSNEQPVITRKSAAMSGGQGSRVIMTSYNGEKNLGEMGPAKSFWLDYDALRRRSWQSYLESELTQILMNKFATWTLGGGLKLQSEPATRALSLEGIDIDKNSFSESVEALFQLFCESNESTYNGNSNLHAIELEAFKNSFMGGDVLVVLRYEKKALTVQLIDGSHVHSPGFGTDSFPQKLENGNRIVHGVELNQRDQIVAYHVRKNDMSYETNRVEARGSNGMLMAYMVYGLRYRLNNYRGIPFISGVLETLKKLERYKEATVGSAEERQKIAYSIEHEMGSTGENPLVGKIRSAMSVSGIESLPDTTLDDLAAKIAATTNKQTFNMAPGSKLNALESKNELYFKDFYSVNIDIVCAVFEMPPNVAMSKYDSNFSASRAALKDWELVLNVRRKKFYREFWNPIYAFWLEIQILTNKIQAPGYIVAKKDNNITVLGAYRKARFVGPAVPHIDPLKEVNAERAKLGDLGKNVPFTTVEQATERLNEGESEANIEQYAAELSRAKELGIDPSSGEQPSTPSPEA